MQDDFLVFCAHEVVDDMRCRSVAARIAEPLGADEAFHHRSRRVDTAITVESESMSPLLGRDKLAY